MAFHWLFQFAVVRVTPNMFVSLNVWGAYVFWALICGLGMIILGVWAPETKGVPLERMEELFTGRWWMGWNAKLGPEQDVGAGPGVVGERDERLDRPYQRRALRPRPDERPQQQRANRSRRKPPGGICHALPA